jgi:aspartokinase
VTDELILAWQQKKKIPVVSGFIAEHNSLNLFQNGTLFDGQ